MAPFVASACRLALLLQVLPRAAADVTYDCKADYSSWERSWSDTKQAWCCSHEGRACPTKLTSGSVGNETVRKVTDGGCEAVCRFNGQAATCRERVRYLASHTPFLHEEKACARAFGRVLVQCPSVCSSCALEETGCLPKEKPTEKPKKEEPMSSACSKSCTYVGKSATCGFRIQWGANHRYLGKEHACESAHKMVLGQCPVCSDCTLAGSTCEATGPSEPFHCSNGYANRERGWSAAKKAWCCAKRGICQSNHTSEASEAFDCTVDADKWDTTWSDSKRAWCCKHRGHGCARSTTASYDCSVDSKEAWPEEKRDWCCKHNGQGCPKTVTTATSTRASSTSTLSPSTSTTRTSTSTKAAPTTTEKPYDCTRALSEFVTGWSSEKKDWCCKVEGICAPDPFHCLADIDKGVEVWSVEERSWCCRHKGQGCYKDRMPAFNLKAALPFGSGPREPATSPVLSLATWAGIAVPAALAGFTAAVGGLVMLRRFRSRAVDGSRPLELHADEEEAE